MSKMNKLCSNIDQSNPASGGFTDEEKARMRNNIGVTNFTRTITNVNEVDQVSTDEQIAQLHLRSFEFMKNHEYHLFISIPSGIELQSYSKDKVIITLFIGANNYQTAPFKMRMRADVEDGVIKNRSPYAIIDWYSNTIDPDLDLLNHAMFTFQDNDSEDPVTLKSGQTLQFIIRGTDAVQSN